MVELNQEIYKHLDKALTAEQIPKFISFHYTATEATGKSQMNTCLNAALERGVQCLVEVLKFVIKDIEKAIDDNKYRSMMKDRFPGTCAEHSATNGC